MDPDKKIHMNILRKLIGGFSAEPAGRFYCFTIKCLRCGEVIEGRIDLYHDVSVEYEQAGDMYYAHKVLMGGGRCFQRMDTTFKFNSARALIEKTITGGEFV
jgi:hypothetical protein